MPDITKIEIVFTQQEIFNNGGSYINDYITALCNMVSLIQQTHDITEVATFYDQTYNIQHPGEHRVLIEFNRASLDESETPESEDDSTTPGAITYVYNRGIYQIESTFKLSEHQLEDLMFSYQRLDTRYRVYAGDDVARIRVHGEKWRYDMNGDAVKKEPDAEAIPTSGEGSRTTQ